MGIQYTSLGKAGPVTCIGVADGSRTAVYAAGGGQEAQVAAFFASDPTPVPDPVTAPEGIASRVSALELAGRDATIQTATPTAGQNIAANGKQALALLHSGLIATLTVTFPTGPRDGQIFALSTKSAITALTLSSGATVIGGITSMIAGSWAQWVYSSTANAWCRIA